MSDPDAGPDPIDKAYGQAEAILDDAAACAARRERVLAAVAVAGSGQPDRKPRLLWGQARWLAAASVAGLALFIGLRFYQPTPPPSEPPPATTEVATAPAPATPAPAAPAPEGTATPAPPSRVRGPAPAPEAQSRAARDVQTAPALPVAPAQAPPPPSPQAALAPPPPPPPSSEVVEDVVVTGSRRAEAPAAAARTSKAAEDAAQAPGSAREERLRAAAAAGRITELTALLNQGVPVDARDDDGETALIKAVRANRPAAAALLRRRGASLDLKNRSGQSARDIASMIGDPALNRALGLAN
jgi:hypothetical protein